MARLLLHRLEHEAGDGGHREVVEVLVPPGEHAGLRHPAPRLDQAREHVGVAAVLLPDLRQHAEQRGVLGHGVRVGLEDVARARVEAAREQVVEAATEGVGRRMRRDHRDGVEATLLGHDGSPSAGTTPRTKVEMGDHQRKNARTGTTSAQVRTAAPAPTGTEGVVGSASSRYMRMSGFA